MAVLSLALAICLTVAGFSAKSVLAGGCVCGGNGGNNCTTIDMQTGELYCYPSEGWDVCCDSCGGGLGCGSKPDDSGCEPGNYMGSCYKCNVRCNDGECWEVCKTHDWTCCPCSGLDIDPDNLTATPLSETSVRLDWTPKGRFNDEGVQQYIQYTNNPSYYFQCVTAQT
jgi:hypothetical protein